MAFEELSWREKTGHLLGHLSVEPLFVLYALGSSISLLAVQNLDLDKACRVKLRLEGPLCAAMLAKDEDEDGYCEALYDLRAQNLSGADPWRDALCGAEEAAQEAVTTMGVWRSFLGSAIPAVLVLFVGAWTDRAHRRKPAMLVPVLGQLLTMIGFLLCVSFFWLPMEVTGLVDAVVPSVTGGWMTVYMAVYSYMGENTSLETRTFRMGVIHLCSLVSFPLGTAFSGHLYRWTGYTGVFLTAGAVTALALWLGAALVHEPPPPASTASSSSCLGGFFDLGHVRETLSVALKKGPDHHRLKVLLLLFTVPLTLGPWQGQYFSASGSYNVTGYGSIN